MTKMVVIRDAHGTMDVSMIRGRRIIVAIDATYDGDTGTVIVPAHITSRNVASLCLVAERYQVEQGVIYNHWENVCKGDVMCRYSSMARYYKLLMIVSKSGGAGHEHWICRLYRRCDGRQVGMMDVSDNKSEGQMYINDIRIYNGGHGYGTDMVQAYITVMAQCKDDYPGESGES